MFKKFLFTLERRLRREIAKTLILVSPKLGLKFFSGKSIAIELSSKCNIQCLCCPVGNKKVESKNMCMEDFKKILKLLPATKSYLSFSHRGDPTMNPNLSKMVRYAHDKGFTTDVYTNGLYLDKHIDKLLDSGLDTLRIDLDGSTEESYLKYRIGSDFNRVKNNISRVVEQKKLKGSKYPKNIVIICVVTSYNEHQIDDITALAKELGVNKILFKTAVINYGTEYFNDESVQHAISPQQKHLRRGKRSKLYICDYLLRGSILYNGDLQMCTAEFERNLLLGNVLKEDSYEKVLLKPSSLKLIKDIAKRKPSSCRTCAVVSWNHYVKDINKTFK